MCIFNDPIPELGKTCIFVSSTSDGRQLTVYQNEVASSEDERVTADSDAKQNAMIHRTLVP